ncbi:MAG: hypothetical protein ACRDAM_15275, partial [Casimicrobium sp.]
MIFVRSPLRSPIRPVIRSPFDLAGSGSRIPAAIAALFASGELGGYYDPNDLSTLFQDIAGTIPATADGQTILRINDKSGRNLHLTGTNGPTLRYSATYGRWYLECDGVNDFLSATFSSVDRRSAHFVCAARLRNVVASPQTLASFWNTTGAAFYWGGRYVSTPFVDTYARNDAGVIASNTQLGSPDATHNVFAGYVSSSQVFTRVNAITSTTN